MSILTIIDNVTFQVENPYIDTYRVYKNESQRLAQRGTSIFSLCDAALKMRAADRAFKAAMKWEEDNPPFRRHQCDPL